MKSSWSVKQPFGFLFKLLITIFIVVIIPAVGVTVWTNHSLAPVSESKKETVFVIKKDESPSSFSQRLQDENLIKNAFVFRIYLKLTRLDKEIQAGSFKLAADKSVEEIAKLLTTGRIDKWVTIVEGLRKEEIAQILEDEFGMEKSEFIKKAEEGMLFPDTYLIPVETSTEKVLSIFKANFDSKFDKNLQTQAKKNGLSKEQVIILASIVERESKNEKERPTIAGILVKRWKEGIRLGADATVQYALGYSAEEKSWWRKTLTDRDLKIQSSYNTRANLDLPPGPISSPGLTSIQAVINPKGTSYYFYLHDSEGNVHYSETFEGHQQNIIDFL